MIIKLIKYFMLLIINYNITLIADIERTDRLNLQDANHECQVEDRFLRLQVRRDDTLVSSLHGVRG